MINKIFEAIADADADANADYSTEVSVELYCEDGEREIELISEEVKVFYDIEVEHRSWGIKGIDVSPRGEVEIGFYLDGEEKTVTVDLSDIKIEWEKGSGYAVSNLSVAIDKDLNIKEAILGFYYIVK